MKSHGSRFLIALVAFTLLSIARAQAQPANTVAAPRAHKMALTSTAFSDGEPYR